MGLNYRKIYHLHKFEQRYFEGATFAEMNSSIWIFTHLAKNRYGQIEVNDKKAFQLKASSPLCVYDWGFQVNKFEMVHLVNERVPSIHVLREEGSPYDREPMTDQWRHGQWSYENPLPHPPPPTPLREQTD